MLLSLRVLADFIIVGLLVVGYMVIYSIPEPDQISDELYYTNQCKYDTESLCPDCFPKPVNCDFFTKNIFFRDYYQLNTKLDPFNHYLYRRGVLNGMNGLEQVVVKNFNPNETIEKFRSSICSELSIKPQNCSFSNNETFAQELRKRILSGNPLASGVRFCPPGDERGLQRFVELFNQPELSTLLLMSTNIHPLMIRLLSQHNRSVPSFVFQGGFLLVESHNDYTLSSFYTESLKLRLRIAYELINAFFEFDSELHHFRFYLMDVNPDNFVVNYVRDSKVKVLFANLKNVIVRNSHTEKQDSEKLYFVHTRIECGGACIGYDPEEVCSLQYSDINLFAVCLLLVERHFWNEKTGFLHHDEKSDEFSRLKDLLDHCAYCDPSNCVDRFKVLTQIQQVILTILGRLRT